MKYLRIILISICLFSCEKNFLKADNEFYNRSLSELIVGYDIWAKEAEDYADQNKWAQKIQEPLIGYLDIKYFKSKKSNADIRANLFYILDVKKALEALENDATKYNYNISQGRIQAGFTFTPLLGIAVYQTWSIPADSLINLKNRKIESLTLDYERFSTGKDQYTNTTGNITIINLNSVNKKTILEPALDVTVFSSFGEIGNTKNSKIMPSPRKLIDF